MWQQSNYQSSSSQQQQQNSHYHQSSIFTPPFTPNNTSINNNNNLFLDCPPSPGRADSLLFTFHSESLIRLPSIQASPVSSPTPSLSSASSSSGSSYNVDTSLNYLTNKINNNNIDNNNFTTNTSDINNNNNIINTSNINNFKLDSSLIPPPPVTSTASTDSSTTRKIACNFCHHSKVLCDGIRPCQRCVRLNRGDQCVDRKSRVKKHPLLVTKTSSEEPESASSALTLSKNMKNSKFGINNIINSENNNNNSGHKKKFAPSQTETFNNNNNKRARKSSPLDKFDSPELLPESMQRSVSINTNSMFPSKIPSSPSLSTLAFPHPIPLPQSSDYDFSDDFIDIDPTGEWLSLKYVKQLSPNIYLSRISLLASMRFLRYIDVNHEYMQALSGFIGHIKIHDLLQPCDLTSRFHTYKGIKDNETANNNNNNSNSNNSNSNNNNKISISQCYSFKLNSRSDDSLTGHCTGKICSNICPNAKKFLDDSRIKFSFSFSQLTPIEDFDHSNYPFITMKMESNENFDQYKKYVKSKISGIQTNLPPRPNLPAECDVAIRVNRAFERTFGMEQKAVRSAFIRHSWFALYMEFIARSDWLRIWELDMCGENGFTNGYQTAALCRHQLGAEFPALIDKSFDCDDDGVCYQWKMTIIPIKSQKFDFDCKAR